MPTRAQNTLLTPSEAIVAAVTGKTWNDLSDTEKMQLSLSHRSDHTSPNMAILVMLVRKVGNFSQMEIGRNRTEESTDALFDSCVDIVRYQPMLNTNGNLVGKKHIWTIDAGQTVSGYFSLIAHIEQGKSQTVVPPGFMEYVSRLLNIPVSVVQDAYAEDVAIRAAFTAKSVS